MPTHRMLTTGLASALIVGGSLLFAAGGASASPRHHSFASDQQLLEQQLASRATQLTKLGAEVTAATLLDDHASSLNTKILAASTSINALIKSVPSDTTDKQLNADRRSMLADNRVFAVLTPQVFQTIEADQIASEVTGLQNQAANLWSMVTSLNGLPGYKNAFNHYTAYLKLVNDAALDSSDVVTEVLAQVPADYPGDTHVFVNANKQLRNADVDVAYANYDATIIGLASGGYAGA